jgi:hypothetical protein
MGKTRIALCAAVAAVTFLGAPALAASASPTHTAASHPLKAADANCPNMTVYTGPIESDIGHYLSDYGFSILGSGSFASSISNPDYVLAVTSDVPAVSWCVQQSTGHNGLNYGGFYLLPVDGGNGLCLDAGARSLLTKLWIWSCNGTSTQVFCWDGAGFMPLATETQLALKDGPDTLAGQNEVIEATGNASQWYTVQNPLKPSVHCP